MPPDMRKTLGGLAAVLGMLVAGEADAQFANRSLGGGLGFVKILSTGCGSSTSCVQLDFAAPLTLEGSLYVENGFDVFLHVPVMIVKVSAGAAGTVTGEGFVFGTGGNLGVRYLFAEESIRPYLGIQLAGIVVLTTPEVGVLVGPGIIAGLDFFVTDTVSIGGRGFFNLFIQGLNVPVRPSFGGGIGVATYF